MFRLDHLYGNKYSRWCVFFLTHPAPPTCIYLNLDTCDCKELGVTHTSMLWIYSSLSSRKAGLKPEPLGHRTTLHTAVQTRAAESENISWETGVGGHPRPPVLIPPPPRIYLNFHGLSQVLQGHLSPHVYPSFTPQNSMEEISCISRPTNTCTHAHAHTHKHTRRRMRRGTNPPLVSLTCGQGQANGIV